MDWEHLARLAPLGTAIVATTALGVAIWSLVAQRGVARKRASIDFFLKTEMDKEALQAHRDFKRAIFVLRRESDFMDEFQKTESFKHIQAYLIIHELISVGIVEGAFDDAVCYSFWCKELTGAYKDCEIVIDHIKERTGEASGFWYFSKVNRIWTKRMERANRRGRPF